MARTNHSFDAIVIGAGLHGASAALHLAKKEQRVLLLDQGSGGRNSSKANAGGLRQLLRAEPEIPLAIEAINMWQDIRALVDDDCGTEFVGQICVAENIDEFNELERRQDRLKALGYDHEELIDVHELKNLVPSISERCVGGLICRSDGFGSPFRSTYAFQRKAESLGAHFRRQSEVIALNRCGKNWRVHTTDGLVFWAPIVVNCAGAWGDQIAAMIGETVPISPEAPMMMVTAPIEPFLKPVIIGANRKLSFKQAPNGTVLIGGGHRGKLDRTTRKTSVDFDFLKLSAQTVLDFFPHMANVPIVRSWAGIEGLTPDRIPVICESRVAPGVFHSFGYSSHGFLLAPITGRLIAELILNGKTSLSIDAFDVSRFCASNEKTLGGNPGVRVGDAIPAHHSTHRRH